MSGVRVCGVPWMDAMLQSAREERQLYSHNQCVQYRFTHSCGHNIDMNRAKILAWTSALHGSPTMAISWSAFFIPFLVYFFLQRIFLSSLGHHCFLLWTRAKNKRRIVPGHFYRILSSSGTFTSLRQQNCRCCILAFTFFLSKNLNFHPKITCYLQLCPTLSFGLPNKI